MYLHIAFMNCRSFAFRYVAYAYSCYYLLLHPCPATPSEAELGTLQRRNSIPLGCAESCSLDILPHMGWKTQSNTLFRTPFDWLVITTRLPTQLATSCCPNKEVQGEGRRVLPGGQPCLRGPGWGGVRPQVYRCNVSTSVLCFLATVGYRANRVTYYVRRYKVLSG